MRTDGAQATRLRPGPAALTVGSQATASVAAGLSSSRAARPRLRQRGGRTQLRHDIGSEDFSAPLELPRRLVLVVQLDQHQSKRSARRAAAPSPAIANRLSLGLDVGLADARP